MSISAVKSNAVETLKHDYQNEKFEERQVNFICEAFRKVMENGKSSEMVPLVIYNENYKVPNGGLADVIEIHGMFSASTIQTAIFRLASDLKDWSNSDSCLDTDKRPGIMTQFEKTADGDIKVLRFVKPKVFPMWAPHRRRF